MPSPSMLRGAAVRAAASLLVLAALSVTGCSRTSLNNMWHDPSYSGKPMKNLLVIGIRKNDGGRRIWEDAFVASLKDKGAQATPSYRLFPNALPDTDQVVDKVRENGYDGVLIVSRMDPGTATNYVPGYTTVQPITHYNAWRGYYTTHYREVYTPGYTETNKVSRNEVMLWSTGEDARMVWTGTTATLNPEDGARVRKEVTGAVVPQLLDLHLLGGK